MIEVRNLRKHFGHIQAVRDVSFNVDKGEVLGFLGPNGAGKTTTMRMITGFFQPTSGTAVINGYDIVNQSIRAKKQMGYLPENAPVYSDMTVRNYLRFIAEIRGFTGRKRNQRVEQTIETCHLSTVTNQLVGTLSKGFNQRVCFGQALLHDPPVLIMDEPTDGLDPNQKHMVRTMIKEMAADKAIVISTHILEEMEAICTRVIIICNGAIVANGSPAELRAKGKTHGAIELTVQNHIPDILSKLESLRSAERVETIGSRYLVYPRDRELLFKDMINLVKANSSWHVTGLQVLDGRMDDVFRELTTKKR